MKDIYAHKPPKLETISDLLAFAYGIPEDRWCVDEFENNEGRRCILGHIGAAYHGNANAGGTDIVNEDSLVIENNGIDHFCEDDKDRLPSDGPSIKARVVAYLKSLLP